MDGIKAYDKWARSCADRVRDFAPEHVQAFVDYAYNTFKPTTAHKYACGVCKAADIPFKTLNHEHVVKRSHCRYNGRTAVANSQGKRELLNPKYDRLITLQRAVGIRRAELGRLKGSDLRTDDKGRLWVHVRRGKGGKEQMQYILPQHADTVRGIFAEVGADERVFSAEELKNKIDLHSLRRDRAQEAYTYFRDRIAADPQYAEELRDDLRAAFNAAHIGAKYDAARRKFERELTNEKPYIMRGECKERATAIGRPLEYDRLALTATSVLCLAHWRNDVTAKHYMV